MNADDDSKNKLIPSIFPMICIGLLLVALCKLPYGYYTLLRLALFIWGIIYGIKHYNVFKNELLSTLSFSVSILYNPIIVVHLDRQHWIIINIITALIVYLCSIEIKPCTRTITSISSDKKENDATIIQKNKKDYARLNISRLVNACLNIQVNRKELFKTTPEKVEALYYVMFMVKNNLVLNHAVSKLELCLPHLTTLLTELKVQRQDIETLIKIWTEDRIITYRKCKIAERDQTLNNLCIWAQHNGHSNATINNVPRIDINQETDNEAHSLRLRELDAWINELMSANIYELISKEIITHSKKESSKSPNTTSEPSQSSVKKLIADFIDNHPSFSLCGILITIIIIGLIVDKNSQHQQKIEPPKAPYIPATKHAPLYYPASEYLVPKNSSFNEKQPNIIVAPHDNSVKTKQVQQQRTNKYSYP